MPELPEVETTRRGIAPHVEGREIREIIVRQPRLRTPVPDDLADTLVGHRIGELGRRAKYLLMPVGAGTLLWHLGMSGSLRLARLGDLPRKHDHVDLVLEGGAIELADRSSSRRLLLHAGARVTLSPLRTGAAGRRSSLRAAICAVGSSSR